MKKISYLIIGLLLSIYLISCTGYTPIFGTKDLKFNINRHDIKGEKRLGNKIYYKIESLSKTIKDNENGKNINISLDVLKDKIATSKNSAGKILEYKIILNTNVDISDSLNENKIVSQNFVSSLTYKVQDQYSETLKLEKQVEENLINKTYEELLIKLSQNIVK